MRKIFLLLFITCVGISMIANGQTYTMPSSGSASATVCTTGNFYDSGGPSANYACCSITGQYTFYPGVSTSKVSVNFSSFTIETCCDYLKIYNGNSTAAPLIGTYTSSPGVVTSTAADGSLTFVFYSDVSVTYAGWAATISITPAPTNPITTQPAVSNTVCQNATPPALSVTASATNTYQWYSNTVNSNSGGTLIAGATNTTYSPPTATSGTKYYYVVVTNGCSTAYPSNTSTLIVNPAPTIGGGTSPICANGTATLTPSITPGNWSSTNTSAGTVAPSGTNGVVTGTATGTTALNTDIVYTVTATGCTATKTITVNPIPLVAVTSPTICASYGSTSMTPNITGGTWLSGSPAIASVSSGGVVTAVGTGSGPATISYTSPAGCVGTGIVTLNPLPSTIAGPSSVCVNATATLSSTPTGGTWASQFSSNANANPTSGVITGVAAGTSTITYTGTNTCYTTTLLTVNAAPNIANFTSPTAPPVCLGNGNTITVNSTSMGAGTFTVFYTLTGANSASSSTTLTMGATSGTFNIPSASLSAAGSTTVTVTGISNSLGCVVTVASSNTVPFTVVANPDVSNFTAPSATSACVGGGSVATVNSTSLGAGTYTVTYNLTGANASSNNTATLTMGASNGTFNIPSASLPLSGTTTLTITRITSAGGCFTNVSSSNTASFIVNPLPNVSSLSFVIPDPCLGQAALATINSSSLLPDGYSINYGITGASTASGNISSVTMASNTGSFAIPSSILSASGATFFTLNSITSSAGCTTNLFSGNTATFTVKASSPLFSVTGGGSYCTGSSGAVIGLSGSTSGNTYQLYQGSTPVGAAVAGTGSAISFGTFSTIATYSVLATNTTTSCTRNMTGTTNVVAPFTPAIYSVSGGGSFCSGGAGVNVNLSGSDVGVTYQLYNGSGPVGGVITSPGGPLSFGLQTVAGSYSVVASPGTSCATNMTGSATVSINPLPTAFNVTGGGAYCAGGPGVPIGLAFGASGVQYTLYNGSTPAGVVSGTNGTLTFGNQAAAGIYSVAATNISTNCTNAMTGTATISINSLPTVYNVTGGGSYCAGGAGVAISLSNSASGVTYQLYNGGTTVGASVSGTGSGFSFGNQTSGGTYSVLATGSNGCTVAMTGSPTITVNAAPPAFSVTGGTTYCAGGAGSAIGVGGSTSGVNYQLYNGSTPLITLAGTGSAISFGTFTASGTYSVLATNTSSGCSAGMSGIAVININPTPAAFNVTGGGSLCTGSSGLPVGLSGSAVGVNYQLYNGTSPVGAAVGGTGSSISFGTQTAAGTYTVSASNASTGCSAGMTGSTTITLNSLPTAFTIIGGGTYCAGGSGVTIGLNGSSSGVNYTLYNGATPMGVVPGTGSPISFGVQTLTGSYSVFALNTSTTCTNTMTGTATISTNPLPIAFAVTGGGSFCSGGAGIPVGLSSSTSGVNYSLYSGASLVSVVSGTGSSISFGPITTAGTYTVQASNGTTGCNANMTGSATVTINANPGPFSVTGGGSYCSGGAGLAIGLSGSATGINYQLYTGATAIGSPVAGTNSAITFGSQTGAGVYTVLATNATTGCTTAMTGSATISVNPSPAAFAVTGGGSYCAGGTGVTIGLTGSAAGVNYQLYNGASAVGSLTAGTGSAISFGTFTTAGTYTVLATSVANSCTTAMSGNAVISINAVPTAYAVGGGATICAGSGSTITLANSQTGVNYQLYFGSAPTGAPVAGSTGSAINFGSQSAAGTYSVLATNATTGCTAGMSGSATISVNAAPTVYTVSGSGSLCSGGAGVVIVLSNSTTGITYNLYNGSTAVASLSGTGSALSFPAQTAAGTYTVQAVNTTTSCTANMAGSATITVNPLPTAFTVTGGGAYCAGGSGVNIGLSGSAVGINYQLYNGAGASGSLVAGTGVLLDFGVRTAAGTYSVIAVNPATGCTNLMTGTVPVTINALPAAFNVMGGGSYCAGGTGVIITLDGSAIGVTYQLYRGSSVVAGANVPGSGGAIGFGLQTAAGTYSVRATVNTTGCQSGMTGTASVTVTPLPTAFTITGGGTYCSGGTGVNVGLNGSTLNISYQLSVGGSPVGAPVIGTGGAISFGPQTTAGSYNVLATDLATGCVNNMSGAASVSINSAPTVYAVIGGGSYCAGGVGVIVSLASSEVGVNYQLYNGASAVGSLMAGTGSSLSFGAQTAAGNYSVVATNATTGCTANMSGSVPVTINALPALVAVTGGGSYCPGGAGVTVGLSNSTIGIDYQLYNGSTAVGAPVPGTGGILSFGLQTAAGTYTVSATNTTTGCARGMTGSAVISISPVPTAYSVTGGGGYCIGGSGVGVGLSASSTGVSYQLYNGSGIVGGAVSGTGGIINFGNQTAAGTYTVLATNGGTGCTNAMSGAAVVSVNPLPAVETITGGGTYCSGGAGLVIGLASSESGVNYQLYNGVLTAGSPAMGSGAPINFGPQTAAGTYNVVATNMTTGCMRTLSGVATIVTNPAPAAFAVAGGGSYCTSGSGVEIHIPGSEMGISYQLFNGSTSVMTMSGTGSSVSFGNQAAAGTYSVLATNTSTGCQVAMPGTAIVTISPLPTVYSVLSTGSTYCAGGTGINILLSGSQAGVSYQLFNGSVPTGAPVPGTGSLLDFGAQTTGGTYVVVATSTGSCVANMSGSASITVSPQPTQFTVTGGGGYCTGSAGAVVGLSGSQSGINYQLFRGTTAVGVAVAGTGSAISFGPQATAGAYVVVASNATSGCQNTMLGGVTVSVNPLPALQTVAGGGSVCSGGAGVPIILTGSTSGINYQLYNGSTLVVTIPGTGSAVTFGPQTAAGVYTVLAVNGATTCSRNMTGSATIVVNPAPTAYNVTGGGNYCIGSTSGLSVGLANSASGFTYQLYNGATPIGGALAGTGSALDFGTQSAAGTYTVRATDASTMCTGAMTGSALIVANAAPVTHNVTGGGSYCSGGTGVHVGLDASNTGATYTLYNGATAVGSTLTGTGSALDFGSITTSGTYTVLASNTASGCSRAMNGSAAVVMVSTFTPTVSIGTGADDTMCLGVLTTFNAVTTSGGAGATFQWQVNGVNVGLGGSSYTYLPSNGDVVAVQMNSSLACAIPAVATATMPVTVLVSQLPVAALSLSPNDTVCLGTAVTLNVAPAYGGSSPMFTWKNGAGAILATGTTFYTFVPSGGETVFVEMASNYRCRLANIVESAHRTIVVDSPTAPAVTIGVTPGSTIAAGQLARFTASANNAGNVAQYQWYVNGNPVAGATTNVYTSTTLSNNDTVTCVVTKISACAPMMGQSSVVMKVSGVGIAGVSFNGSDIILVPNPNKGDFVLKGTVSASDDQELVAEVTDMLGQVVYRHHVVAHGGNLESHISLDNSLANGMYILTLHSATDRKVFHFMIGK